MNGTVAHLLDSYGYWVVFAFVAIESLGIPLPGETALVTAAAFAALGHFSIIGVIATAAAGAILGDATGYWVGSVWLSSSRSRTLIGVSAALLIVSIGISRLYLGVHYFSDVVAGYAAGILWLSACISSVEVGNLRRLTDGSAGSSAGSSRAT